MIVLLASFGASVLAALLAWGAASVWWRWDAAAPRVTTGTVAVHARRHYRFVRWVSARFDPEVATGSVLALIGAVVIIGGGVFGVVLAMVRAHRGFADFDTSVARFGATHATATSTHVLRLITQVGGAFVLVPIAVVVGGQYALADAIKAVVDRARPDFLRLTGFSGPSFPSGHATASAATFAAFALLIGRGRSRRAKHLLVAVAVGATVLICATRVMLGVHWLTDVTAGVVLGWTWFALTSVAFGGRRLRFGAPAVAASRAVDGEPRASAA